jgi:hypothetical protein
MNSTLARLFVEFSKFLSLFSFEKKEANVENLDM